MKTADFDYDLPPALIASTPAARRDESRLCVLDRDSGECTEARFAEIGRWLRAGDLLVVNSSRVFPARLIGERADTGGRVELLLIERLSETDWLCMAKPAKRQRPGGKLRFGDSLHGEVIEARDGGMRVVRFAWEGDWWETLAAVGHMPLPPYIVESRRARGESEEGLRGLDAERYQTVYARERGSVAAPTAGLHFTEDLIAALRSRGIEWAEITLHVGPGTFLPVKTESVEEHRMHSEAFSVSTETAEAINAAKREGRRVIAVGTTSVRVLETLASETGEIEAASGSTDIFIRPGHEFRCIDAMITNFHLPCSTLLMLVSAFAGRETMLAAYRWAVEREFRFYSYGDAMLIV
jgi:S-adenosylmethionine:tRNA ribosyltransferase-isomerase